MLVTLLTLKAATVTLHTFCYLSTPYWGKDNPRQKSLEQKPFVLNFLQISYIHSSHLYSHLNVPLSFPNVEPRVFWSTEMTAIPESTSGKEEITQLFQDLWRVLKLTCSSWKVGQPSQPCLLGWRTRYKQVIGDVVMSSHVFRDGGGSNTKFLLHSYMYLV